MGKYRGEVIFGFLVPSGVNIGPLTDTLQVRTFKDSGRKIVCINISKFSVFEGNVHISKNTFKEATDLFLNEIVRSKNQRLVNLASICEPIAVNVYERLDNQLHL